MSGIKFMGKDPKGIAKAIKTDSQGNIVVSKTPPSVVDHKYFLLDNTSPNLRVDEVVPCTIQSLTFRSTTNDSLLLLRASNSYIPSGVQYFQVLATESGIGFSNMTPKLLYEIGGETSFFKLVKYEVSEGTKGDFVIILKRPIYAPLGFTLQVRASADPDKKCIIETSVLLYDSEVK